MKKAYAIFIGFAGVGVLAWLLFGFFGVQALFVNQRIQEAVPLLVSDMNAATSTRTGEEDVRLSLGEGVFMQGDSTYRISGTGTVFQEGGRRKLALTDFEVTNGPDLYVYVVNAETTDNTAVKSAVANGAFVSLGRLKGNIGDQVYELPEGVNAKGMVVSIWCKRFSRNFGSALIQ